MEKEEQKLSSEMLKRKRTKGSESQAPIPEERSEREAPVERLWERSREGRKETNRKLSTGTGKESMRDQAGRNGENQEAKAEGSPEEQLWEANQGGAKGNKQEAEYGNLEGRHERSGRREGGKRRNESGSVHRENH